MNLNKLLPRFSIRAKLAIAFTLLAVLPLIAVVAVGTRTTIRKVRTHARETLQHDVESAQRQMEQSLEGVAQDIAYLASMVPGLLEGREVSGQWEAARPSMVSFLAVNKTIFRLKVFGADGRLRFAAHAPDADVAPETDDDAGGLYYVLRAQSLEPGERLMMPVELRRNQDGGDGVATLSAVAILLPIIDPSGTMQGTIVGEAYASLLFDGLEPGSPHLGGVTGLVDSDGFVLYHSALKRDWSKLLISPADLELPSELSPDVIEAVLSGSPGTVTTADKLIVSFVPLRIAQSGIRPLMLYRAIPRSVLEAPVRDFLGWVTVGGAVVLAIVLGLAVLAAHQLTQPIYQLRQGARRLAEGATDTPLEIETNDELEDLAADFSAMAEALSEHRHKLEDLVAERTRELLEAHAELEGILRHSADAIVGLDAAGRIRVWNQGAESLFGYTTAEAVHQDVDVLLLPPGADSAVEAAFIRHELETHGAVVNLRTTRVPKDGEPVPVSLTQTLIRDEHGEPLGHSLIIRDITAQAKLEEHMLRSERLAAVSVMAAGLAHEVNNPLAVIGNRIECMQQEVRERWPECNIEADLAVLHDHTNRLRELTRDLLRFAKDEGDEPRPLALDELLSRVARLMEQTLRSRSIHLDVHTESDLPQPRGSEKAIETVCMNLLMNAADATPPGGVVTVETRRSVAGAAVEFEVSDTGTGVPPELQHRIFEPFFTTKGSSRGTGLGLALCRSIIERHGGSIRVEARKGGGSRFIVSLPVTSPEVAWTSLPY